MKKTVDITEELKEMAIFLKNKFASRENLLAHGLEKDYDRELSQSGSKKLTLPERIRILSDQKKAKNISYCEKNYFRHVPMLKHKPKKPKNSEVVSQIESEIIELAEQNNLRLQAKLHTDDLSFFKRKLALQTKMIDPTRVPNNLAARQFDADFLAKYQAPNLSKSQMKMRKILLGSEPPQYEVNFDPRDSLGFVHSPNPAKKGDSRQNIKIQEPDQVQMSRFKRLNENRVYNLDRRPASESKLMGKSVPKPGDFGVFSQGYLPKGQSQEKSEFSRLDVRDYAVDKSLGPLYKQTSLRVVRSAANSGAGTPTRGAATPVWQSAVNAEHSWDNNLILQEKSNPHGEGSDPQQHSWRPVPRPGRTKNLTYQVSRSYEQEKQQQLLQRLSRTQSGINSGSGHKEHKANTKTTKGLSSVGSDVQLHRRKQTNSAISELERTRLAAFHQSRWVNELAYPSRQTDGAGMKDVTPDVSKSVDGVIQRRVVGEVLDRTVRYHFYRSDHGRTLLAYSKDPEVNATFPDMHRALIPLSEVSRLKLDFGPTRGMIDDRDGVTMKKEKYVRSKVLQIYKDLEKDTIPGILNFELASKIADRFINWRLGDPSPVVLPKASRWRGLESSLLQMIDFKYLVGATLEDIVTFGLTKGLSLPAYKTIGIFDAVRASSISKYRSVCARDRLLKFCRDEDGRTPLIRAVESSKATFVKEMLKQRQPVDHRDKFGKTALYYALKRRDPEIIRALLLNRAKFEDEGDLRYRELLTEFGFEELCFFLKRVADC